MNSKAVDSLLFVSFGGPEGPEDVMPFLRTVTAGRGVPDERLAGVAEHYLSRGGKSPINDQNRSVIAALKVEFERRGIDLPIYWGNRNWHPFLDEALATMQANGHERTLAFVTSAYSSYSGCRQYREDLAAASERTGTHIQILKLRQFFNHPGFVGPLADGVTAAMSELGQGVHVLFSAHSIPRAMAAGCRYEAQLNEAARLIVEDLEERPVGWDVVYQSRSGRPQDPWLEPDVNDRLAELAAAGISKVVVCPIGFVSDHMEVVHDLDEEAAETAERLGIEFRRSPSPGTDSRFVTMIADLVVEQLSGERPACLGDLGPVTCLGEACCPARSPA